MTATGSNYTSLTRRDFRRILLIKPSSLGDLVHALPVLYGLRRRYPDARIDWLAADAFAPLIEGHPDVTKVIRFDRRRYGKMAYSPKAAAEFAAFVGNLRARKYDLVVDLQGLFRSGFLAAATGAGVRIGFAAARELAWIFYTHRIPTTNADNDTHAVDRNYRVAGMLGFADLPVTFDLAVTPPERRRALEILHQAGCPTDGHFAAILPGARWDTKRWPEQRFAEVIDLLWSEQGTRTVLLAGPDEAGVCARIVSGCRTSPVDLAGRTTLRELVAVLDRAGVVICHDSAPMHLAAALGRPLVCILGPTNPARTGPYCPEARILRADWPCVPCYLRRLSQCDYQHRCMTSIAVSDVLQAVDDTAEAPPAA